MKKVKSTIYQVGIYLRLSRDDRSREKHMSDIQFQESYSITNQRKVCRSYLDEQPDMALYDTYIDDGYSGSNFERPDYKRLMEDIYDHKVNCVIVKDLSRMGREYIELGRLLQKTFPALGVRFIAIGDHFDSKSADTSETNIVVPMKNFVNESYCSDISQKVRYVKKMQRENGEYIGPHPVYGYKRDKMWNKLIVDEYPAQIIRTIYRWKMEGISAFASSNRLNEAGILSPMAYKASTGSNYHSGLKADGRTSKWTPKAVLRILRDEVYTGTLVQGKQRKQSYKIKKMINVPPEEWVRVEDTHEAIISRAEFEIVQHLLEHDGRVNEPNGRINMYASLLFCADCREQMIRKRNCVHKQDGFICSTYNRSEGCTRHTIIEEDLTAVVQEAVKKYATLFLDQYEWMKKAKGIQIDDRILLESNRHLKHLAEEKADKERLLERLAGDFAEGLLTEKDFETIRAAYQRELEDLEKTLERQEETLKRILRNGIDAGIRLEALRKATILEKLDRYILVNLVKNIFIHEDNRIEIEFNFMDQFQVMQDWNTAAFLQKGGAAVNG